MNTITQRRQDERERRRTEIVDAAEAMARELGWDRVTVDALARRARLSRALVYLYFKDKTELHAALFERAKAELYQRFRNAVERCEPAARFEAIGRAYIGFAREMPHLFEALSRFEARPGPDAAALQDGPNDVHRLMVALLHDGQARGVVRADCGDLDLTAVALWAFTHGLIQISSGKRSLLEAQGIDIEALLDQAFSMLGRSIDAPSTEDHTDA